MKKLNENCHNCGAPVKGRGLVKCQYCGTEYMKEGMKEGEVVSYYQGLYSSYTMISTCAQRYVNVTCAPRGNVYFA